MLDKVELLIQDVVMEIKDQIIVAVDIITIQIMDHFTVEDIYSY